MPSLQNVTNDDFANNRVTHCCWQEYGSHRRIVTSIVLEAAANFRVQEGKRQLPSLAILGAGNVNDLNLGDLLSSFGSITLFDLDSQAVHYGVKRQHAMQRSKDSQRLFNERVQVVAPIDLSCVNHLLKLDNSVATKARSASIIRRLAEISPLRQRLHLGEFDVVSSTCMMSQLIRQVNDVFESSTQEAQSIGYQLIVNHLQLALALTAPLGQTLLITDMAGTSTGVPEMAGISSDSDLLNLSKKIISEGRHFAFLSPRDLLKVAAHLETRDYISSVEQSPFWKWQLGEEKHYLCYALQIARSQVTVGERAENAIDRLATRLRSLSASSGITVRTMGVDD